MTRRSDGKSIDVSDYLEEGEGESEGVSKPADVIPTQITENLDKHDTLVKQAGMWLGRPREGIHVSDLDFMKRAYWQKSHPEVKPSERDVGYYLAGRGHHGIIQWMTTLPECREVEVNYDGVSGHMDMVHDVPIELKTTRMHKVRTAEELREDQPHYFARLGFYCAMSGSLRGRLILFYLSTKTEDGMMPLIKVYDVEYDDLDSIRREITRRRKALERALGDGDPSSLPDCPSWMCDNCRYRELCKPQR